MYSNFLTTNSRAKYIRYNTAGQMMIKYETVPSITTVLNKDALAAKTPDLKQIDVPTVYASSDIHILLIIHAAGAFLKNEQKTAPFHAQTFRQDERLILN